ncbi:DUF4433 domain-containing protein [Candidatus Nomurabacteria bacterium]|nr:DUF4433 domain-containing protein [Candidatus Nomurabacteria bacterium]
MKILNWIARLFKNIRSRFLRRKKEQSNIGQIAENKAISQEEINIRIIELLDQTDIISADAVLEIAVNQTAVDLQELTVTRSKVRKRIFEHQEIEREVTALNNKLMDIQIKQNKIESVIFRQNYSTDKDIEDLEHLFQKNVNEQNLVLSTSANDKLKSRYEQFGKFIQERILVRIYKVREEKRAKEEETKKQQIKELIGRIENQINQVNLHEAQIQIAKAAASIVGLRNPDQRKDFREKLENLKLKFRQRQIQEEAKRQDQELKRQQEEAERRRLAEEAKREEERKQRAQQELIKKQQEEEKRRKEEEKKHELQRLLTRKLNWQEYSEVLQKNEISILYHFTDRANISTIKQAGGLYSWAFMDRENIYVPRPGSGPDARWAARQFGLTDFISLSFISDHPMKHVAFNEGRISDPILLTISTEVCFWINTRFSTMNAADNRSKKGSTVDVLKECKFSLFKEHYFNLEGINKKYYQAEVLVKTWIPIEYITNINQF